jgi:hypothetical protein
MNEAAIVRATMNGWAGIEVTDTGADATVRSGTYDPLPEWNDGDPLYISRDPQTEGLAIQWRSGVGSAQIGTVVGPGDISSEIFFSTNMTQFQTGEVDVIDTAVTAEANVLVPQIPEPASMLLMALGAASVVIAGRRR